MRRRFLLAAMMAAASPAWACLRDSDCLPPDTCHFAADAPEGLCLAQRPGALPSEATRSAGRPLGTRKDGDSCQFSVDCAPGQSCFKPDGGGEGLCFAPP